MVGNVRVSSEMHSERERIFFFAGKHQCCIHNALPNGASH